MTTHHEAPTLDSTDAAVGKRWRENSSLEEWFPYTAQELNALRERLRAIDNAKGMPSVADKIRVVNISENGKKTEVIFYTLASEYDSLRLFTLNQVASLAVRTTALKKEVERTQHLQDRLNRMEAAAVAVVKRWHTPAWKDAPATANYINDLRDTLDAALLAKVEGRE